MEELVLVKCCSAGQAATRIRSDGRGLELRGLEDKEYNEALEKLESIFGIFFSIQSLNVLELPSEAEVVKKVAQTPKWKLQELASRLRRECAYATSVYRLAELIQ